MPLSPVGLPHTPVGPQLAPQEPPDLVEAEADRRVVAHEHPAPARGVEAVDAAAKVAGGVDVSTLTSPW